MLRLQQFWKLASIGLVLVALALLFGVSQAETESGGTTVRVSVASNGTQANDDSQQYTSVSDDGRFVAFQSLANNLVANDTNGQPDVFVHDRVTEQTTLVSVSSSGEQGNAGSGGNPSTSADGRYVAFTSEASNLVQGDTNRSADVFVHDRVTGETRLVSWSITGQAAGGSSWPDITTDGRFVAFTSSSTNLVANDTNGHNDVFVHNMMTGETTRVSVSTKGIQGNNWSDWPSISGDGRYITFVSYARTLIDDQIIRYQRNIFVHDREMGATTVVSVASSGALGAGESYSPIISDNGRYVAFYSTASDLVTGDINGKDDVFVHDRNTGATTLVSVSSNGAQGNQNSRYPSLSSNGRYVVFESTANSLIEHDHNGTVADIFIHDRETGQTTVVSVASDGTQGNQTSYRPLVTANGQLVIFSSDANNLVENDTNGVRDIFVYDRAGVVSPTPSPTPLPQPTTSFHSGFDPKVHGYNFDNFNAQGNWETYVETYGTENSTGLLAQLWYVDVYKTECGVLGTECRTGYGYGGACFGMTSTSSLIYANKMGIPQDFSASTLHAAHEPGKTIALPEPFGGISYWRHTPVSDFLMVFQGRQHTKESQCEVQISIRRSLEETVRLIQKSIESKLQDNPQLMSLTGRKDDGQCASHSVLPIAWEGDDKHITFTVYDPSNKDEEFKTITVNLEAGTWRADMSANNGWGVWESGQTCGQGDQTEVSELRAHSATVAMTARLPIFGYTKVDYCAGLIKDGHVIVSYGTTANVTGGEAERFPNLGQDPYEPHPIQHYMFEESEPVTVTLEYSSSHALVDLVQPGRIIAVESEAMTGTVDTLTVDIRQGEVLINTNSAGIRDVSAVSDTRRIDLSGFAMDVGNTLLTRFDPQQVVVSPNYGQEEYTLHLLNQGITSTVEYTLTMPAIDPGDMHLLQPSITSEVVLVGIDAGSDGVIDDTIELKPIGPVPTSHQLYLPLINR